MIKSDVIRFGVGEKGNKYLNKGWGSPEKGFVWSEGTAASLDVPVPFSKGRLSISMWGYVPSGAPDQDVLLFLNGLLYEAFQVHDKEVRTATFEGLDPSRPLKILLYIPHAKRPRDHEDTLDIRQLGVALSSMVFDEAD